jgi:hypothetical protein
MKLDGCIMKSGVAQPIAALDPTAAKQLAFYNKSADRLVIAYDGYPASPTHGVIIEGGANVIFYAGAEDGLAFPWGALSVFGTQWGQAFSVVTI